MPAPELLMLGLHTLQRSGAQLTAQQQLAATLKGPKTLHVVGSVSPRAAFAPWGQLMLLGPQLQACAQVACQLLEGWVCAHMS